MNKFIWLLRSNRCNWCFWSPITWTTTKFSSSWGLKWLKSQNLYWALLHCAQLRLLIAHQISPTSLGDGSKSADEPSLEPPLGLCVELLPLFWCVQWSAPGEWMRAESSALDSEMVLLRIPGFTGALLCVLTLSGVGDDAVAAYNNKLTVKLTASKMFWHDISECG